MAFPRPSARRLRARFADRDDIGREQALRALWSHLPPAEMSELADLIEREFALPFGLLRPEDSMERLTAPFAIGNPLTWLWAEGALEDAIGELWYQHGNRKASVLSTRPATMRELCQAWCEPSRLTSACS